MATVVPTLVPTLVKITVGGAVMAKGFELNGSIVGANDTIVGNYNDPVANATDAHNSSTAGKSINNINNGAAARLHQIVQNATEAYTAANATNATAGIGSYNAPANSTGSYVDDAGKRCNANGTEGDKPDCKICTWGKCADMNAHDHPANATIPSKNLTTSSTATEPQIDVLPDDEEDSDVVVTHDEEVEGRKEDDDLTAQEDDDDLTALLGEAEDNKDLLKNFPCKTRELVGLPCEDKHQNNTEIEQDEDLKADLLTNFPCKTRELVGLPCEDKHQNNTEIEVDEDLKADLLSKFPCATRELVGLPCEEKHGAVETEESFSNMFFNHDTASATVHADGEVEAEAHEMPVIGKVTRNDSTAFNSSNADVCGHLKEEETHFRDLFDTSFLEKIHTNAAALLPNFTESFGLPTNSTDMQSMFLNYYNSTAPTSGSANRRVTENALNASHAQQMHAAGAFDEVYYGNRFFNRAPALVNKTDLDICTPDNSSAKCLEVVSDEVPVEEGEFLASICRNCTENAEVAIEAVCDAKCKIVTGLKSLGTQMSEIELDAVKENLSDFMNAATSSFTSSSI